VIGGCNRIELADGTELRLLAEDKDLDVAALATPNAADTWLTLASGGDTRLGQPVHALGFPYYGIAGTSLHLTGGNVSALVGVNDDGRFFSFTAPVQPGNSGGPLIARNGVVMGLVVSRLSDRYIEQATGTLPQNINYALSNEELVSFLARSGVLPKTGGLGTFDPDSGVPRQIEAAVLPVICD
jgi:S1-C subfamily serine protease